jgi:Helix-turn-helix domain
LRLSNAPYKDDANKDDMGSESKQSKKRPFKVITDAPAFRDRLGELTGNELKVWMYLWLRTNGELTAFPGNDTMAMELGINVDTVKAAKKGLRAKGWTSRESQRTQGSGAFSTVVEKVHLPWGKKESTATVGEKTDDGKTHQEVVFSIPEVSLSAHSENQNLEELKKEGRKEDASLADVRYAAASETEKEKSKPLSHSEEAKALQTKWGVITGYVAFADRDWDAAEKLLDEYGAGDTFVMEVMVNTLTERPKSASMPWRDFWKFAEHFDLNRDLYLAYQRKTEIKANSAKAGQPEYRKESGKRQILKADL